MVQMPVLLCRSAKRASQMLRKPPSATPATAVFGHDEFGDDVSDVSLRLDIVQLAGLDDRADGGGALAAGLRPGKQPVLAADRDGAIARSAMCYRSLGDRRRGPA